MHSSKITLRSVYVVIKGRNKRNNCTELGASRPTSVYRNYTEDLSHSAIGINWQLPTDIAVKLQHSGTNKSSPMLSLHI